MERIIWDKNFKLTGDNVYPTNINYKIRPLHPEEYFDSNENLTKIEYYKNWDVGVFSDLVLEENITYTYGSTGFLEREETTITWYLEDGTAHPDTKIIARYYSGLQAIEYGKTRRGRQIDRAKIYIKTNQLYATITEVQMFEILSIMLQSLELYKEGDMQPLINQVTAATQSYFDNNDFTNTSTTIRAGILAIITDTV